MADLRNDPTHTVANWNGQRIEPGETKNIKLAVSESYSGMTVQIPIQVRRAAMDGPTVVVSAAIHGDEVNGTGAIRHLIQNENLELVCGNLVLIPVMNMLAFDRHSRYLPDRRDLNRCFPGSTDGSLASRLARRIFDEIVCRCDYGIDLHTASVRRTNYPSIRGDLSDPRVELIAKTFGTEVIVDSRGQQGTFRREATLARCSTIVMEGGEVWKVEPTIVESTVKGVTNVLRALGMLDGEAIVPEQQIVIRQTKWMRAEQGGFLQFHVKPGDLVEQDQPLATNTNLLGIERSSITAPFDGVIIGMTTLPAVSPGEPICNVGKLPKGTKPGRVSKIRADDEGLEERLVGDLASNVLVVEPNPENQDE